MKCQCPRRVSREHAVQHGGMDMDVEIEGAAKPLDHGHRAPTTVPDAAVERASAQEAEHGADEHGDDTATQLVVPRQLVTKPVRQAQHPLPHGHIGEFRARFAGGELRSGGAGADRGAAVFAARCRPQIQ